MINSAEVVALGVSALTLLMLAWATHKIGRIHAQGFAILAQAQGAHREAAAVFGQVQALLALERRLQLPEALPPLRGWVGSPDFLLALSGELLRAKPEAVLECGSGASTVVIARCLQKNGTGHVYSLEHEPVYAERTRTLLVEHGLADWATVVDAPLEPQPQGPQWYSLKGLPAHIKPVELLVVDGPPYYLGEHARYPALQLLEPWLAANFSLYLDDADREDERAVVDRWMAANPTLKLQRPPCEKGLAVLKGSSPRSRP